MFTRPSPRHRASRWPTRLKAALAGVAVTLVALTGAVLGVTVPASAATPAQGEYFDGDFVGNYVAVDGSTLWCLDPTAPVGSAASFSGDATVRSERDTRAIAAIIDRPESYASDSAASIAGRALWMISAPDDFETTNADVLALVAWAYGQADALASATTATAGMSFSYDSTNPYAATLTITSLPAGSAGGSVLTLTHGVFVETGTASIAVPSLTEGQSFAVQGRAPEDGSPYRLTATLVGDGSSSVYRYASRVATYGGGAIQLMAARRVYQQSATVYEGSVTDPFDRATGFLPALETTVETPTVQPGADVILRDILTPTTLVDADGVHASWPVLTSGAGVEVRFDGELYRTSQEVVDGMTMPADAVLVHETSITTRGEVVTVEAPAGAAAAAGYYAWVWTLSEEQGVIASRFIASGDPEWTWTSGFLAIETTTVSPDSPVVTTQAQKPEPFTVEEAATDGPGIWEVGFARVHDVATITGRIEDGTTLDATLYCELAGAIAGDRPLETVDRVTVASGVYEALSVPLPDAVIGAEVKECLSVYWVEVLRHTDPDTGVETVLHTGAPRLDNETVDLTGVHLGKIRKRVADTGLTLGPLLGIAAVTGLGAAGAGVIARRRDEEA